MIANSTSRFSEKITLEQKVATGFEPDGIDTLPRQNAKNKRLT